MIFDYTPKGVCSKKMRVTLDDQNVIEKVEVLGGCSGNLQGISSLVVGMPAQEAIRRMRGIRCGLKDTSCPDQLAHALEAALAAQNWEAAFRAAHTLKGVAQNLGLETLYKAAATLTDAVRGPKPLADASLWPPVQQAHQQVLQAVAQL